jgi:hypothetical protein
LAVAQIGIGATTRPLGISGNGGLFQSRKSMTNPAKEQHMSTVALIDRKTSEIIQLVETTRVQWSIDQLMRNRDPRYFVAREVTGLKKTG